jgi:hypothetical protein
METFKKKKRAFKISGEALEGVIDVSSKTHRNLSGSIEYLIMQGYKVHKAEAELLASVKNKNKVIAYD